MSKIILIHTSTTETGGIVNATIFYAASLRAAGHAAEIWTASKNLARQAATLSIPVFYHSWLQNAGLALISPAIVARALAARRNASAAIHQSEKLWLFGRVWLSNLDESTVFHNPKINQRRYFRRWLAISEQHRLELENFAQKHGLKKAIRRIRNGPLPQASQFTPRDKDAITAIGCMGNFGAKKAVDILVRAFAQLIDRGHDLRLVLAGDGPGRNVCEDLARDLGVASRISWPGWLTDTRAFYDEIDLFCLPSVNEPFGIVLTEAMQAGLPVVATYTSGPQEIVVPGETGWLAAPNDVTALAAALQEAVENPARARSYGMAGLARFEGTYSLTAAGKTLAEALV
jgi:glycosyltransferase involved in cell wall biosynthesis